MNKTQINARIMLLRVIDWSLLLVILGAGIPAMFLTDHPVIFGLGVLAGLGVVHMFGNWSGNKIAALKVDLKRANKQ